MHSEGSLSTDLAQFFEHLVRRMREDSADSPLSHSWASVLSRLDADGPLGISELACHVGISQPGMTQLIDRIAHQGYVERMTSPRDRRVTLIGITPAGLNALNDRRAWRTRRIDKRLEAMAPSTRATLAQTMPILMELINQPREEEPEGP